MGYKKIKLVLRSTAGMFAAALLIGAWAGCEKQGPAEKAGEKMDETMQEMTNDTAKALEEGPMEKAGEKIDEAVDETGEKVEEAGEAIQE